MRAALTQTVNAWPHMPPRVEDLPSLAGRLEEIRRANVEHHLELMRLAKAQQVSVICFGELFPGPYFALAALEMWKSFAEDVQEGPTVTALKAAARAEKMIVVAPLYERSRDGKRFNTAVVIDENGSLLGTYRKTHIPNGRNEQGSFVEGFYYDRSDGGNLPGPSTGANVSSNPFFPVFQTSAGRIGVAICYDRHFEGAMSALRHEGAQLVFSPAVTFGEKSRRMWPLEFQVDATRHRLFVGGSNRKGAEAPWNQPYFGESYFCGPEGVLPDLSTDPRLVIADLDLAALSGADPSGWNLSRDTRPEIYRR